MAYKKNWEPYEIHMIYENGVGDYIELKKVGLEDPNPEKDLIMCNHADIELVEKRGVTFIPTSESLDMFNYDDRAFRESVKKKKTWNPYVLFRTWLVKRKFKNG